jgi:hypothetical protein
MLSRVAQCGLKAIGSASINMRRGVGERSKKISDLLQALLATIKTIAQWLQTQPQAIKNVFQNAFKTIKTVF